MCGVNKYVISIVIPFDRDVKKYYLTKYSNVGCLGYTPSISEAKQYQSRKCAENCLGKLNDLSTGWKFELENLLEK